MTKNFSRTIYSWIAIKCELGVITIYFSVNDTTKLQCWYYTPIVDRETLVTMRKKHLDKSFLTALKSHSESQVGTNILLTSGGNAWSHCQQDSEYRF